MSMSVYAWPVAVQYFARMGGSGSCHKFTRNLHGQCDWLHCASNIKPFSRLSRPTCSRLVGNPAVMLSAAFLKHAGAAESSSMVLRTWCGLPVVHAGHAQVLCWQ